MVQRTVLKVDISCQKCKKKLLKAVSSLDGVDKIEVDEVKGTLTVTGNADPYEIIIRTRKAGKHAEVVSVGPPPPPPKQDAGQKKPDEKKAEEKKPEPKKAEEKKPEPKKTEEKKPDPQWPAREHLYHDPYNCLHCRQIYVMPMPVARYDEPNPSCSIM